MSERYALLLDIDGTLMDTLDLIVQAMNAACEDLDVSPPFRSEELRTMIGTPVQRQVGELRDVTGSLADAFTERYHAHFIRGIDRGIRLFPGVAETFPLLSGRAMTTMSTRRRSVAEQMLRVTDLLPYFRVVVGGDQVRRQKPDPELPFFGAKALGVSPSRCFVIGDSPVDLFAGRAAGMKTIAVSYGYGDSKAIALARPDEVIHDFSGLPTALARFEH